MSFTLYDLRHTFASRLFSAGIPVVEVSAWMGHAIRAGGHDVTNTTTRVYAHATGEWRQAALAELSALVDGEGVRSQGPVLESVCVSGQNPSRCMPRGTRSCPLSRRPARRLRVSAACCRT